MSGPMTVWEGGMLEMGEGWGGRGGKGGTYLVVVDVCCAVGAVVAVDIVACGKEKPDSQSLSFLSEGDVKGLVTYQSHPCRCSS